MGGRPRRRRDARRRARRSTLRRKQRDFEFPRPAPAADPFLVYDSAGVPARRRDRHRGRPRRGRSPTDGARRRTAESVSRGLDGTPVEVLRRTRAIAFDAGRASRSATARRSSTSATTAAGLEPGDDLLLRARRRCRSRPRIPTTSGPSPPPTEVHRSGRVLYDAAPGDRAAATTSSTRAGARAPGAIPEATPTNGQLRRFVDLFGAAARPPAQPRGRPARPPRRRHGRPPHAAAPRRAGSAGT